MKFVLIGLPVLMLLDLLLDGGHGIVACWDWFGAGVVGARDALVGPMSLG